MKANRRQGRLSKSQLESYRSKNHSDGFIAEYEIVRQPPKNLKQEVWKNGHKIGKVITMGDKIIK